MIRSCRKRDIAASEVIGTVLLISIVVIAGSIIAVAVLSQPQAQKIPAVSALISNQSQIVYIKHNGGDPIQNGTYRILVDGADVTSSINLPSTWSIGNTLTYTKPGTTPPSSVEIVYTGAGSTGVVLTSAYFGQYSGGTTPTGTATTTATPTLVPAPMANFTGTPRTGSLPLAVQFTDLSTNTPTAWNWSFGDGSYASSRNPSHSYATAGTYTVSLTAINTGGSNSSTKTGYIVVSPLAPVANFSATPLIGTFPLSVQFTDLSTNTPTAWNWSFGDGSYASNQNPSHSYATAGTYTVSLTATNAGGSNSITKIGYITVIVPVSGTVTVNSDKGGYVEAGSVMQFHYAEPYAGSITLNGVAIPLNNSDTVKLVWGSNEYGSMYLTTYAINGFSFNDILVYINNNYQGEGPVSSIYNVNQYDQYQATLNLDLPAVTAWTQIEVGSTYLIDGSNSSAIRIFGLSTPISLNAQSNHVDYTGGASGYIFT